MANNRICCVDKKSYHYCPTCYNDANKPKWMTTFCSENCKKIFDILVAETVGKFSTDEARNELVKLDLSHIEDFEKDIKAHVKKVLTDGTSTRDYTSVIENSNKTTPKMTRRKNK